MMLKIQSLIFIQMLSS